MHVSQLMRRDVRTIAAQATVAEAIQSFADAHVSGLPVIAPNGAVLGVITTTDVLQAEAEHDDRRARNQLFEHTTVNELMSSPPVTIGPEATVRDAAKLMLERGVHRLFVVDADQLVGVLSQTDLARALGSGAL